MAKPRSSTQLKDYNRKRDFKKTAEPEGAVYAKKSKRLAFVVQKHEASHLHYDIRLEVDGVMKSWACPKGPSFDPSVKRLAVQVEDHPTSYNTFEGQIPAGEYGGGTVMIWDKGYYTVDDAKRSDDAEALMREGIEKGKLAFTFHGQKLKGSFTLVRTRMSPGAKKAQWLLIKHRDDEADPNYDPVGELARSAATKRTMKEIEAEGTAPNDPGAAKKKVRSSTEVVLKPRDKDRQAEVIRESIKSRKIGKGNKTTVSSALKPMLVHKTAELLEGDDYIYEQKLDGVRLLAYCDGEKWTVVSRLGNDKSAQFPEIGPGLLKLAKKARGSLILDGEVVAVDQKGLPLGFQDIQGRIHTDNSAEVKKAVVDVPAKFFVFDILLLNDESLLERPLRERRALLEKLFKAAFFPAIQLNPVDKSAKKMRMKASTGSWEGLIIKDLDSPYLPGVRTKNWLKWKIVQREELIIAGWTVPRGSRQHIGSLLLGYHDDQGRLIFAGHVGSGFSVQSLKDLYPKLKARERKTCPFAKKPATNETAHWVKPELVAEVKFHEWTAEGNLRHGTFLGLRDDKQAGEIVHSVSGPSDSEGDQPKVQSTKRPSKKKAKASGAKIQAKSSEAFHQQMEQIKDEGGKKGEGYLSVGGSELRVTHLDKVMFTKPKVTKQDLLQYYYDMADYVLPWMEGRPLVMRRFPKGITGQDFYQQTPDEDAPGRIVTLKGEDGESQKRIIGGDLITLLYLMQMGCISYDPWHARVESLSYPDYTILDLDPLAGTSFETVRQIALVCLDVIESKGFSAGIKTSGATGLHIYLPLPPKTKWDSARLAAEILCAEVAEIHPKSTVERMVKRRPRGSVYLDSQQNYLSKSVAGVWSVRAKPGATVSTPISRKELEAGIVPADFNLANVLGEAKARSLLWTEALSRPVDLKRLTS